jgi:hypothetical protein
MTYNAEFYQGLSGSRPHNEAALWGVFAVLGRPGSFIDFGCGDGWLVYTARTAGVPDTLGLELSPDVLSIAPPGTEIEIHDLGQPLMVQHAYDLVISWEVGEHLEEKYADNFCRNLANATGRYLVFTAAAVGQGGYHHVNCQNQDYWRWKLTNLGLAYKQLETNCLRAVWEQTVGPLRYLPANLQVFERA